MIVEDGVHPFILTQRLSIGDEIIMTELDGKGC